jgi:Ca2+/H+ antiporter, TMEM165/GDT1 family
MMLSRATGCRRRCHCLLTLLFRSFLLKCQLVLLFLLFSEQSILISAQNMVRTGEISGQQRDATTAAVNANNSNNNNKNDLSFPPPGLFERMDLNHDAMLSLEEYTEGWPIIAKEFPSSRSDSYSSYYWFLPTYKGGFWKGFTSGVAMILATEIGDKTFFIAAVLSMRQQRSAVFCGAIVSLYVMTVLSSIMGLVLPRLIPVAYTHILGGILFLYFGIKLLLDAKGMEGNRVSEELEEVEEELLHPKKADEETADSLEVESGGGTSSSRHSRNSLKQGFSKIAMQSFTLTFLAEWGDRSQIATIALSAAKNPYGVTLGGCIGHTLCTGLAVLGGRMLAARISEKTVSIFGGIIFLVFGIHSVFFES